MWCTVGTETPSAPSGTIEEFKRVKERNDTHPVPIRIMFYFKDAPPASLSDINTAKLQGVRDFQESLGDEGGLIRTFKTVTDFEKMVFRHLTLYLKDLDESQGGGIISKVPIPQNTIDAPRLHPGCGGRRNGIAGFSGRTIR